MSNSRLGLRVSSLIFGIFGLGHLIRIATGLELRIADRAIPMWPSVVAVLIAGFLSLWLWTLSGKTGTR